MKAKTDTQEHQPADVRRLTSGHDWYGYLTLTNLDAVANRIRDLIGDGQRYTSVCASEGFLSYRPPEVRTGCVARSITVSRPQVEDRRYGIITFHDHALTYFVETAAGVTGQASARALDERLRPAYLHITHNKIEVTSYAPNGDKSYQVFAVEERGL
jgi:hypothetical protein